MVILSLSKDVVRIKLGKIMKTMYVYILECSDNSYYIGVSNDAKKRLQEHSTGINRNCYTYLRRPLKLVFSEIFSDPNSAIAFEKKIKGWSRAKKKALIEGEWKLLPELSKSHIEKPTQMLRQAQHDSPMHHKPTLDQH